MGSCLSSHVVDDSMMDADCYCAREIAVRHGGVVKRLYWPLESFFWGRDGDLST